MLRHVCFGPKTEVAGYSTTVYEANSSSKALASFYCDPHAARYYAGSAARFTASRSKYVR